MIVATAWVRDRAHVGSVKSEVVGPGTILERGAANQAVFKKPRAFHNRRRNGDVGWRIAFASTAEPTHLSA